MRIKIIGAVIFSFMLLVVTGLFYLQVIKGPYYQRLSKKNRIRLLSIESPRGRMFDRNKRLLVDNRISFDVAIISQELKDRDQTLGKLAGILGITEKKIETSLKKNFVTPFQPTKIVRDIGKSKAITIEERKLDLPGVIIETAPKRHYVCGMNASHMFGYLGLISSAELSKLKSYGYVIHDLIGRSGIEKTYNNYLKGLHGGMQIEVDNRGYQVGILGIKEPVKGKDLYLTIDMELQDYIEEVFADARGGACVIDPRDGQVLALVSSPSFDPNSFVSGKNSSEIKRLLISDKYPLLNRLVQCSYPPGSVFKVVTASAAMENRRITEDTELSCEGSYRLGDRVFRCWWEKGHGRQNLKAAIMNSCNVYFWQVGRLVGVDEIAAYAKKFGYGYPTGVDLPDETGGLVPSKRWKLLTKKRGWYKGETLNYAIGQGYLLTSPLQVARMMAVVANGGYLVKPYIVKYIEDVDISRVDKKYIGISKKTLGVIRSGLAEVVANVRGTGKRAAVKGLTVAGKTGTAQTSTDKTHAWFSGFAPVDAPKAVLVVFLEYGGKGGLGASRTAGDILRKMKELGYFDESTESKREAANEQKRDMVTMVGTDLSNG